MNQLGPFLVLIGAVAVVLALLGALVAWFNQEARRIRRGLRKVLRAEPHALIVAPGRGRGAGFNFTSGQMAVAWDSGGWCLIYKIEELLGAELIVDGQVAARVYRGEARRPLEVMSGADRQVALRLIFDDPQHADFNLELWTEADARARRAQTAAEALEEGNRWIARTESVFRRRPAQGARGAAPAAAPGPAAAPAAPAPRPQPAPELRVSPAPQPPAEEPAPAAPPAAAAPRTPRARRAEPPAAAETDEAPAPPRAAEPAAAELPFDPPPGEETAGDPAP